MKKKKRATKKIKTKKILRSKPARKSGSKKVVRVVKKRKPARRPVAKKRSKKHIIKPKSRKPRHLKRTSRSNESLGGRHSYSLNSSFEFFPELQNLILKSSPAEKNEMIRRISKLGRVKLAVISGVFMKPTNGNVSEDPNAAAADLFIVGDDINKSKLRLFLRSVEAETGTEVRFTLMDLEEFRYRFGMFDRFVRVLLEGPHEKIINRLEI